MEKVYIVTLVTDYAGQMQTDVDVLGTYFNKKDAIAKMREKKKYVLEELTAQEYTKDDYYIDESEDGVAIVLDYDGSYLIDVWEQEVK